MIGSQPLPAVLADAGYGANICAGVGADGQLCTPRAGRVQIGVVMLRNMARGLQRLYLPLGVALCLAFVGTVALDGSWGPASAGDDAAPARFQPHYESLATAKTNLRRGPSFKHHILWVYHRKGLPVKVLSKYDVWRRVQMPDGTVGWLHRIMLSDQRSVLVTAKHDTPLRATAAQTSKTIALAQPGVTAMLERCTKSACEIETDGLTGWIDKKRIWGVSAGEVFP